MIRRLSLLAGALAFVALLNVVSRPRADAAQDKPGLQPGTACTLYFRGDAAGQSVQAYIPSISNNASISGTLVSIDDQWVIMSKEKKHYYVPRNVILMIQTEK